MLVAVSIPFSTIKSIRGNNANRTHHVSIPFSTIKRITPLVDYAYNYDVSIPFSTIKSLKIKGKAP